MKPYLFYSTPHRANILHSILHGDSVHLHSHCTNPHIILTKQRSTIVISYAIQSLSTPLEQDPYNPHPQHASLQTTLLAYLHHYEKSPYTPTNGPPCTATLPSPNPTRHPRNHRSIQSSPNLWAQSPTPLMTRNVSCPHSWTCLHPPPK